MIYSDKKLSQKIERTDARSNADFVETRARLSPESDACWIEVAGAYAMFDGIESPLTQTFGLGMFDEVTPDHLDQIENFYRERGAPVFHEVSPFAGVELLQLLVSRGYAPVEMTSVMCRPLTPDGEYVPSSTVSARPIEPGEAELWAETSAAGWATEHESLAEFMLAFGRINTQCTGAHPFIADVDGKTAAAGMLFIYDDVAILAGASTRPESRKRGAQNALLAARLAFAAAKGCIIATMGALPGSQSQKNAQKNGFQIAYTRTKWQLG
jgi:hypothetical protein